MEVQVRVTRHLIDTSKPRSSMNDPVGRAIQAAIPYGQKVAVGSRGAVVLGIRENALPGDPSNLMIPLPVVALDWLRRWDAGDRMEPLEFSLLIPDPTERSKQHG